MSDSMRIKELYNLQLFINLKLNIIEEESNFSSITKDAQESNQSGLPHSLHKSFHQ